MKDSTLLGTLLMLTLLEDDKNRHLPVGVRVFLAGSSGRSH